MTVCEPAHCRSPNNEPTEVHLNAPTAIAKLQLAAQSNSREAYAEYSRITTALHQQVTLRGMLRFKDGAEPVPLEEVTCCLTLSPVLFLRQKLCSQAA